ncbi:Ribosomal protein L11 methyltransferase [Paenibacillus larvae subsp. larvae DSM 25430]|nr:Ribosomal protein L11 methyltransferase [Paenibacillus larvae subsp. larvae DSM 25430]
MVRQSDLLGILEHSEKRDELNVKMPVQIVVANILAEIILLFVEDVYQVLEPGGLYIVSGVIRAKQAVVEDALKRAGFEIVEIHTEEDWVALVARKM